MPTTSPSKDEAEVEGGRHPQEGEDEESKAAKAWSIGLGRGQYKQAQTQQEEPTSGGYNAKRKATTQITR